MQITLMFDEKQIVILDKALGLLPYHEVVGLIENINKQIAEQVQVKKQEENNNSRP